MNSDGTSTPDGGVEGSAPADGDPDLDHENALARRLGELGAALGPEPDARERARQRLLAALAAETHPDHEPGDDPSRAS